MSEWYIRQDGTYIGTVHVSGGYILPDGTYIGKVHMSGWYMILVYCTVTVITQISVFCSFLDKNIFIFTHFTLILNIYINTIYHPPSLYSSNPPFLPR